MGGMRGLAVVTLTAAVLGAVQSAAAQQNTTTSTTSSGAQSQPAPRTSATTTRAQPNQSGASAVQQLEQQTQSIGDRANRAIVGDRQQNENNWAAAHPREAERREAGQGSANAQIEGLTSKQPEGRTNMQPEGRTSMQPGENVPPPANEPGGLGRVVRDVTQSVDRPGTYDPFAIEVNPLGLFVGGRLSFNAEWAPAVHHALELSPHFVHTTSDVATSGSTMASQAFTGIGGELGYRYYTGHRGPNGIFIGPSLIAGVYNAGLPSGNQPFTNIGIAADVGVQDILWNHLVVGGGVGIEYLSVSHNFGDLPTGPSTIASSGFKPRLLLSAGYGF